MSRRHTDTQEGLSKLLLLSGIFAGFLAGGATAWALMGGWASFPSSAYVAALRLEGQRPATRTLPEKKPLEQALSSIISSDKSAGTIEDASVYLVQFNTGFWV